MAFLRATLPRVLPHHPQRSAERAVRPDLRDLASSESGETTPRRLESIHERKTEQHVRRAPDLLFNPGKGWLTSCGMSLPQTQTLKGCWSFSVMPKRCLPEAQPLSRGTRRWNSQSLAAGHRKTGHRNHTVEGSFPLLRALY